MRLTTIGATMRPLRLAVESATALTIRSCLRCNFCRCRWTTWPFWRGASVLPDGPYSWTRATCMWGRRWPLTRLGSSADQIMPRCHLYGAIQRICGSICSAKWLIWGLCIIWIFFRTNGFPPFFLCMQVYWTCLGTRFGFHWQMYVIHLPKRWIWWLWSTESIFMWNRSESCTFANILDCWHCLYLCGNLICLGSLLIAAFVLLLVLKDEKTPHAAIWTKE